MRSLRELKQKDLYQVLDEIKSRSANLLASQLAIGRESDPAQAHTSRETDAAGAGAAHSKPANRSVSAASSRSGKSKAGKRKGKALEAEDVELDPYAATQKKLFNDALEYRYLLIAHCSCIAFGSTSSV